MGRTVAVGGDQRFCQITGTHPLPLGAVQEIVHECNVDI
jgi:hypothetical protein